MKILACLLTSVALLLAGCNENVIEDDNNITEQPSDNPSDENTDEGKEEGKEDNNDEGNASEPDYTGLSHLTFSETDKIFPNPERGFYKMYDFTSASASPLSRSAIQAERIDNTTLFYTGYYLTNYMTSDIDDSFLQLIRKNMQTLRDNGAKCMRRTVLRSS